jgi:potassium-dependent mechanosensitive channel
MTFDNLYAYTRWQRLIAASFLVVFIIITGAVSAFANQDQVTRRLEIWRPQLESLESALKQPDLSDSRLAEIKSELETIEQQTLGLRKQLLPDLKKLEQQFITLGPKPEGVNETEEITKKRAALDKRLAEQRSLIKQLDVNAVRANQIADATAGLQRTLFTTRVLTANRSILNPGLWLDGAVQFDTFWQRVARTITVWLKSVKLILDWNVAIVLAVSAVFSWFFAVFLRRRLDRWLGPNLDNPYPSKLERLWLATRTPLVNCLSALLTFTIIGYALNQTGFLSLRVERLYVEVVRAVLAYVLIRSLTSGVLAPEKPEWRLPKLSDNAARSLKRYLDLLGLVLAVDLVFTYVSSALFMPVQFTQVQSAVSSIALVVVAALTLLNVSRSGEEEPGPPRPPGTGQFLWVEKFQHFIWLVIFVAGISLLSGHLALGLFLSHQLIATLVLVVIIYLLHCLVDEILTTGLAPGWVVGDFLRKTMKMSDSGVGRIALLGGTTFDFILVFIGLPLIVSLWALTWVDLNSWVSKLFFGFEVGGVNISLSVVFIAALAFLSIIIVTRLLTRWLDTRVLSRTQMNRGVRDSIKTAMGYTGIIIATLFAMSFTGLDFSKVAIVAGALSLGIGFGLQSVVNNFVSGLILLVERPIKVGDWIVVTGGEGYVKNIKVRSTEIETFDRATVIVPNSSLISEPVQNWTHSDTIGRVKILVGVSYDADPRRVEEILVACARNNEDVLAHPAPWVVFSDFGASSLDFELRGYLRDVERVIRVSSSLRFDIFDALKAAGIEIPYPQRDINFRDINKLENILKSTNNGQ